MLAQLQKAHFASNTNVVEAKHSFNTPPPSYIKYTEAFHLFIIYLFQRQVLYRVLPIVVELL